MSTPEDVEELELDPVALTTTDDAELAEADGDTLTLDDSDAELLDPVAEAVAVEEVYAAKDDVWALRVLLAAAIEELTAATLEL